MFCCCTSEPEGTEVTVAVVAAFDEEAPIDSGPQAADEGLAAEAEVNVPLPFTAVLDKPTLDTPLGLHLDLSDGTTLQVIGLRPGVANPVRLYNESAPEGKQVLAGDYIMAVNGFSGSSVALADAIRASMRLQLLVQRPARFRRLVEKFGEPLGLDLNYSEEGSSLVVARVSPGAVQRCASDIRPGDRITAVNGIRGNTELLLEAIKESDSPMLELSRVK